MDGAMVAGALVRVVEEDFSGGSSSQSHSGAEDSCIPGKATKTAKMWELTQQQRRNLDAGGWLNSIA